MQIGTIISLGGTPAADGAVLPGDSRNSTGVFPRPLRPLLEILGQSLLDRMKAKARQLTAGPVYVVPESPSAIGVLPSRAAASGSFVATWERAVAEILQQGAQHLLLLRVASYTDLDFGEFLRFHLSCESRLTQAHGPAGALDVAIVTAPALRNRDGSYRRALASLIPRQERFFYNGYTNPLKTPQQLRQLVEDGLNSHCNLKPLGTETTPGVWLADNVRIADTARIKGPVFIGAGSRIADWCTVTGPSSIERGCQIDCGTNISQSCILQGSYVGVALNLEGIIVNHKRLFHLERNVDVEIGDTRLISPIRSSPGLAGYSGTYGVQ